MIDNSRPSSSGRISGFHGKLLQLSRNRRGHVRTVRTFSKSTTPGLMAEWQFRGLAGVAETIRWTRPARHQRSTWNIVSSAVKPNVPRGTIPEMRQIITFHVERLRRRAGLAFCAIGGLQRRSTWNIPAGSAIPNFAARPGRPSRPLRHSRCLTGAFAAGKPLHRRNAARMFRRWGERGDGCGDRNR